MTWDDIDTYLSAIADATKIHRSNVVLIREGQWDGKGQEQPVVVTKDNWYFGYLKPDAGYGSRINQFIVKDIATNTVITSFGLYEFPSCCAFCVSTQAVVNERYRRRGINKLSNAFRQLLAQEQRYSALICTDIEHNEAERKTLLANGFKDIYRIKNKRTRNIVCISVKEL